VLVWWSTFIAMALGSELDVARGQAALQRESYAEARDLALAALDEAPRDAVAQQLYIDAMSAAGFGSRALVELAAQPTEPPPWLGASRELRAAVAEGAGKRVRDAFKVVFDGYPAHPELLAPIWDHDGLAGRLAQWRVRRRHLSARARSGADVTVLYRQRQLAAAADRPDWVAPIDEALVERGQTPPPARPPRDRIERTRYAERLAKTEGLALEGYPSELVDVLDRASQLLFQAGRHDRVVELAEQLQTLTGAPEAWSVEADAWRRAGELARAREAADEAIARATDPRDVDLGATNEDLQRATLSRALRVSAEVHEASDAIAEAQIDLALAHVFARRVLDDKLAKRIERARRPLDVELQARFLGRGDPAERSLAAAQRSDDPSAVLGHVRDAMLLLTVGTKGSLRVARDPDAYAVRFARPMLLRSRAEEERGRVRLARSYAVMATLLAPQPVWWAERAGLQQQLGEDDAAFVSYATARGRGVPELDTLLAETFVGLGDWRGVADHEGGPPPDDGATSDDTPARTVTVEPLPRPPSAPRLGEPMPSFVIPTRTGRIDSTFLRGRVVVLSFFDVECDACLQMLPQFGTVARRLRDRGLDAVVIAVSVDEDPEAYERVAHLGGRWGEVVHDPALAKRFGVERLPTTWLADPGGTARFYVDHWISGDELIDYIGQIR